MTIIIYFPLKNSKLIPHVKSTRTRASCLNDREIGPKASCFGSKAMLFCPAPAKLLSWNQKSSLSQHLYSFASLQHVWTRLRERECLRTIYSFSGDVRGSIHMLQPTFRAPYWLLSARSTRSKYHIRGLKRWTRMHDVHVCKRTSFAGSAGSICKLIHMWEILGHKPVCTRMKGIGGHSLSSNRCCYLNQSAERYMRVWPPAFLWKWFKESEAKWWTRKTAVPMAVDFVYILFRNSKWVYHEEIYPLKLSKVSTSGK